MKGPNRLAEDAGGRLAMAGEVLGEAVEISTLPQDWEISMVP